jgi:translocation and assembly module TamB
LKPVTRTRKILRRSAIGVAVVGVLFAAGFWWLGREATLQTLVQKIADASGGHVEVTGVSGTLYGKMHFGQVRISGDSSTVTIDNADVNWSPMQLFSGGIEISAMRAASVTIEARPSKEPSSMPDTLAPPFPISIGDARVDHMLVASGERRDVFKTMRLALRGDAKEWQLKDATATTQWGQLTAGGKLATSKPFKVDAGAALVGPNDTQLRVGASGNLTGMLVALTGKAYGASGTADLLVAPFEQANVRTINAKLDLPAKLKFELTAAVDAQEQLAGSIKLNNPAKPGPLDKQLIPLRSASATLGGKLSALQISGLVVDLGEAGTIKGSGSFTPAKEGARFALHTERLDLKALHSSMRSTRIGGDIQLSGDEKAQALVVQLAQDGLKLGAHATIAGGLVQLERARLQSGASMVDLTGTAKLDGPFKLRANVQHLNPAAFGDFPEADINARANASGMLADAWKLAADFTLDTSRIGKQPLSGSGSFQLDAKHVSNVKATLALAQNKLDLKGSYGLPGEELSWLLDGQQLNLLYPGLTGALRANGVVTGSMATGATDIKGTGTALRFEPASFGVPIAGSINGGFDLNVHLGGAWRAGINIALQPSTLGSAALRGHAKVAVEQNHVASADIELQAGPNTLNARGAFGRTGEQLDWRLDAPQLNTLGAQYAGALNGSGSVKGMWGAPALVATVDGKGLLLKKHRLASINGTANFAADALTMDLKLAGYEGAVSVASARLQSSGTPQAHSVLLQASADSIDARAEIKGGWNGSNWTGTLAQLQNKGSYAFALQSPAPLKLVVAADAGVAGLLQPEQISLSDLVVALPTGSIKLQTLSKQGARWQSQGTAAGVPLRYVGQSLPSIRDNMSGDLSLGADWSLDVQGGASRKLAGGVHVFRERGDLTVGVETPTALGLSVLDARADISGDKLRVQLAVDGSRNGSARLDATTELREGHLTNASPLAMTADADLRSIAWLAPVLGQSAWEVDGKIKASLRGSGTFGNPALNGTLTGDSLALRWAEQGVKLRNGQLRAQLSGDQMQVQRLAFEGPQGTAVASGTVRFANGDADVDFKLVADKLELLSRPDRTVVLSGTSTLVRDQKHFQFNGKFKADRARIELAPLDRPTLSDDVVVLGRDGVPPPKPAASMPLGVDLEADLGDNFALKGMGLDAQMAGVVRIRSVDRRAPRATGSIRVVTGTYYAYGKKLQIERGVLNFTGAYDNPGLNILAVRKQADGDTLSETNVEAGVEVRGTALAPVAKLVSTPNVPDSEKLAWLVLGHGLDGAAGQEFGVLSAAASALMASGGSGFQSTLATSFGVDELGLAQAKGLETTVVTVGKRLSQRAYLSFEQGASTATSLVKLRYKLNPRITLQFQTGANTALDVLYSWTFD